MNVVVAVVEGIQPVSSIVKFVAFNDVTRTDVFFRQQGPAVPNNYFTIPRKKQCTYVVLNELKFKINAVRIVPEYTPNN